MKYLMLTLILFLGACSTMPEILPDNTSDNVIMMQLKNDINQGGQLRPSYGWIFWYGPIAVLALMWGFRELIKKPSFAPTANFHGCLSSFGLVRKRSSMGIS